MKYLYLGLLVLCPLSTRAATLTPQRVDELRAQIRKNFFIPEPLPALETKVHRRFNPAAGVTVEAITYATQLGMRVPVIVYWPEPLPNNGTVPAFIVVNGHGGDKYAWYAHYTGMAFARAGMAVVTFDPAGEGERSVSRKSGTRDHDKLQGDEAMARRLGGLLIGDVMQAVSYLRSRPEIDSRRIGAGGYSLGSFILAVTGAIEPRLRACVLVGGGNLDGPGQYWDGSKQMCQGHPYKSLAFLGDRAAVIYALHAARGPLLMWNGRADTVVNMPKTQEPFFDDLRARVIAVRGNDDGVFSYGFTDVGSHRPYWLTKPAVAWLEQVLDFPSWTEASLRTVPEAHIGEWAARTEMPMDKLYATEEREGGTMAVGDGGPGVGREQLSVFTAAEWETEKSRLTFDVWTERARAALEKSGR
jgi:dienelactone hydrolase